MEEMLLPSDGTGCPAAMLAMEACLASATARGGFPMERSLADRFSVGRKIFNPSLKSDRDRRRLTALQGEVAIADQTAHLAVADPNRQAPQPHPGSCAVRLHPLGDRRPETRYIWFVIFRQRVAAARYGVPHLKSVINRVSSA